MKAVQLAFGRGGLAADFPQDADVIEPRYLPGLADEAAALRQAGSRSPVRRCASWSRAAQPSVSQCATSPVRFQLGACCRSCWKRWTTWTRLP